MDSKRENKQNGSIAARTSFTQAIKGQTLGHVKEKSIYLGVLWMKQGEGFGSAGKCKSSPKH